MKQLRNWQQFGVFLSLTYFFSQLGILIWSTLQQTPTTEAAISNQLTSLHLFIGVTTLMTVSGSWIYFRWRFKQAETQNKSLTKQLTSENPLAAPAAKFVTKSNTKPTISKPITKTPQKNVLNSKRPLINSATPKKPALTVLKSTIPIKPKTVLPAKMSHPPIAAADLIPFDDDKPTRLSRAEDF